MNDKDLQRTQKEVERVLTELLEPGEAEALGTTIEETAAKIMEVIKEIHK